MVLGPGRELLVRSKYFVTESIRLQAGQSHQSMPRWCQLWICVKGSGTIEGEPIKPGEVWLLPETAPSTLRADSGTHILQTYVPES